MQYITLEKEPDYNTLRQAFDYQQRALEQIADLEYAAIFHEQGLGKSKIAIDLALLWLKKQELDTILIVTKKTLVANWKNELAIHSKVVPCVLEGNSQNIGYALLGPARIMICHYELLKKYKASIKMFCEARSVGILLDESQKIKNPNSSLTQAFLEVAPFFRRRVILTGTPIANRPHDIWSQIYFLDFGKSLGEDFNIFKQNLDLSNKLAENPKKQSSFIESLESIAPALSKFVIRETKKGCSLKLPQKILQKIVCQWEPYQRDMYINIREDFKTYVVQQGNIVEEEAKGILKRILRLQQICSLPNILDENYEQRAGKLDALDDLLEHIFSKNEKVIIWTQFIETANWLASYLKSYGVTKVNGKLAINERNNNLEKFKKNNEIRCLIATYGAAKEGLTLTVANNSIFFDRSLSLDDFIQSQDRIHRISQQKECNLYILEIEDSIEQWVDELLEAKFKSAQLALCDITSECIDSSIFNFGKTLRNAIGINDEF